MWSNNAGNSLIIADIDIAVQKITPSADNCFYITWQKSGIWGYSLYMQKVDINGNILWPVDSPSTEGVLVYARKLKQNTDYSVTLDNENNVYIGIDSGFISSAGDPTVGGKAVACKVSPDGELLFGTTGIILSEADDIISPPVLAMTASDGNISFSWGVSNLAGYTDIIATVKADTQGKIIWKNKTGQIPAGDYLLLNSLQPSEDGSVVFSYLYTSPTDDGRLFTRDLKAKKLGGSDGSPSWDMTDDGSVYIYTHPFNQRGITSGISPAVLPDNLGGFYFATPGSETVSGNQVIYLQRINSDGKLKYMRNGIKVTDENTLSQSEPVLCLDYAAQGLYVLYNVSVSRGIPAQLYTAAVAQYFDQEGNRQWGEQGITLDDYTTPEGINGIPIAMLAYDGSVMAVWLPPVAATQSYNAPIRTSLIDSRGEYIWQTGYVDVKTSATQVLYAGATVNTDDTFSVISWIDNIETAQPHTRTLRAQNISKDGVLGL